jgi:DMSO reductase family type II enzyme chaperone
MRQPVRAVEGFEAVGKAEAAARSQLYLLLSETFRVPDPESYEDARSGQLKEWVLEAMGRLPYPLDVKKEVEFLTTKSDYEEFNSEFIRLFEVGAPRPPCPLNESGYVGGQIGVFKELVSFYNFFDLSVSKAKELPDHLRIELDFMHFLTFQEVERARRGLDAGPFLRAERDFQTRHLSRWIPALRDRVIKAEGSDFYRNLTEMLNRFVDTEGRFLAQLAAANES